MKIKKVLVVLMCMALIVTAIPTNTASAWKVKTHNYSANLILEEVMSSGGNVTIAPFGQFQIAPEFYTALKKYPEAYRAGSLGPDAFPDIYVGQGFIHPLDKRNSKDFNDDITSGKWIKDMVDKALALPEHSEERYEVVAFILGYMTHYAGDLFGHTYINEIASGAYPDMADLADPDKAEDALSIILKHISSEGVIDSKIPKKYTTGNYINIDAPNKYLIDAFIYDGAKDNGLSSMYNGIDAPQHYKYLVELRSFVKSKADYYRQYENSNNIFDYAENTAICNYLDAWLADIDRAIDEWINVSERIAKGLIDGGDQNDLELATQELRNWVNSYGKYVTPAPDVLVNALNLPGDVAKFFKEELGVTKLEELYNEFSEYINDMIMGFMIYDVMGMTAEQVAEMKKAISQPNLILGEEVLGKMEEDMKNFDAEIGANRQEFAPFYNTLTMVKLILIGPDGYNKLIDMVYKVDKKGYNYSTASVEVDNLRVAIKTKGGMTWNYESIFGKKVRTTPKGDQHGTDDDIYFGVKFRNGKTVEQLFDKSGYNDFESGDYDVYNISLKGSYKLGDISKFYIKKRGTGLPGPDWKPEYFNVDAYIGNTKYKSLGRTKIDYYIKGSTTKYFDVNFGNESYKTALNSDIINWLGSLDNSLQWQHDDFVLWSNPILRKAIFYNIFKDVEKYDDIEYDPYVFLKDKKVEAKNSTKSEPQSGKTKEELTALAESLDYVDASNWAISELKNGVVNELVKDFSILDNCKRNITRKEFAYLTVNLYEALIGTEAQPAPSDTFTDTSDTTILKAYKAGIVGGVGKGRFAPNDSLTREAMAVMFKRAIDSAFEYNNKTYNQPQGNLIVADKEQISSWAKDHVKFVFLNKIITGDGTNFNPKGTAPVEQAIAIVNRVFEKYNKELKGNDTEKDNNSKTSVGFFDDFNDDSDEEYVTDFRHDAKESFMTLPRGEERKAILKDYQFQNATYTVDVKSQNIEGYGDAGILFNVSNFDNGRDKIDGYYAYINEEDNAVRLGLFKDLSWKGHLVEVKYPIVGDKTHKLKVEYNNSLIKVYVDDMSEPLIEYKDSNHTHTGGMAGLRMYRSVAEFNDFRVESN